MAQPSYKLILFGSDTGISGQVFSITKLKFDALIKHEGMPFTLYLDNQLYEVQETRHFIYESLLDPVCFVILEVRKKNNPTNIQLQINF